MQRYLASDLPQGGDRQMQQSSRNPRENAAPQAVHHATQLGYYVLEQRGLEGAAQYAEGLLRVLSEQMVEPVCRALQISMPVKKETPVCVEVDAPQVQRRIRSSPDMEMILKLMQLMKGDGKQDLSALVQLFGGKHD